MLHDSRSQLSLWLNIGVRKHVCGTNVRLPSTVVRIPRGMYAIMLAVT